MDNEIFHFCFLAFCRPPSVLYFSLLFFMHLVVKNRETCSNYKKKIAQRVARHSLVVFSCLTCLASLLSTK